MAFQCESELIGEIKKNNRGEYIRVSRCKSAKGDEAIDIREYYTDKDDNVAPTKKGLYLNSELVPQVLSLILKAMSIEECIEFHDELNEAINTLESDAE